MSIHTCSVLGPCLSTHIANGRDTTHEAVSFLLSPTTLAPTLYPLPGRGQMCCRRLWHLEHLHLTRRHSNHLLQARAADEMVKGGSTSCDTRRQALVYNIAVILGPANASASYRKFVPLSLLAPLCSTSSAAGQELRPFTTCGWDAVAEAWAGRRGQTVLPLGTAGLHRSAVLSPLPAMPLPEGQQDASRAGRSPYTWLPDRHLETTAIQASPPAKRCVAWEVRVTPRHSPCRVWHL